MSSHLSLSFTRTARPSDGALITSASPLGLPQVSMGGPYLHAFLTAFPGLDAAWKDEYVGSWISFAGSFDGGNQALDYEVTGRELCNNILSSGLTFDQPLCMEMLRTWPAVAFLMPTAKGPQADRVIATHRASQSDPIPAATHPSSFTPARLKDFLLVVGAYVQAEQLANGFFWEGITDHTSDPGVPVYCFYATNVSTPIQFNYWGDVHGSRARSVAPECARLPEPIAQVCSHLGSGVFHSNLGTAGKLRRGRPGQRPW